MTTTTDIATDLLTPLGAYLRLRDRDGGGGAFLLESVERGRLGRFSFVGGGSRLCTLEEAEIGAVFLLSAGAESALSPVVGRLADRRGSAALVRVAALGSAGVTLLPPLVHERFALGAVVVGAGLAYGVFWIPAMTGLIEGTESLGLDASFAFALMNLAWAAGQGAGSFGGGALGGLAGDLAPYWLAAGLCLVTLAAAGLTRPASRAYPEAT